MTDNKHPYKSEWCRWKREFWPSLRKATIGLLAAGIVGSVGAFVTGQWSNIVAIWNFPATAQEWNMSLRDDIHANARKIERNADEIRKLRLPNDIFEVNDARSGPVAGPCVGGEDCAINVQVRRVPGAEPCILDPTNIEWFYLNPRNSDRHNVRQITGRASDVGDDYQNFLFRLSTPFGLEPDAELCVRPSYRGCPGQLGGDEPIAPDVECFSVPIQ